MSKTERPAVFVDRDGTIIKDTGYPSDPQRVELFPEVGESLLSLQRSGYLVVIVSNQSGIGRGIITEEQADAVHQEVVSQLQTIGLHITGAYYCPHAPSDDCTCRKPSPEMLLCAARELEIDLADSFMVGDKGSDVEAGSRAGCETVLFGTNMAAGKCVVTPDYTADAWPQIASLILNQETKP